MRRFRTTVLGVVLGTLFLALPAAFAQDDFSAMQVAQIVELERLSAPLVTRDFIVPIRTLWGSRLISPDVLSIDTSVSNTLNPIDLAGSYLFYAWEVAAKNHPTLAPQIGRLRESVRNRVRAILHSVAKKSRENLSVVHRISIQFSSAVRGASAPALRYDYGRVTRGSSGLWVSATIPVRKTSISDSNNPATVATVWAPAGTDAEFEASLGQ